MIQVRKELSLNLKHIEMSNYRKFVKLVLLVCCVIYIPSAIGKTIASGEKKINIL